MSTATASDITHLGDRLAQLRRLSGLTQEQVADRAGVSVDVVRKLEQHRKHAARLPRLHALARAVGVELATLIGDPPAITANGVHDPPALVELRRAVMPSLVPKAAVTVVVQQGRRLPPRLPVSVTLAEALAVGDLAVLAGTDMNLGGGQTIPVASFAPNSQ